MTLRMFDCRKPVIAAVNGAAVGIGVTMLLPMDVRIASSEARFGFVFSQRGIVPEAASSWFLPRLVGIAQALDWCYSGRVFGAEEALAGRLVSRVVAPEELIAAARALARSYIDATAPVSVALIRQMMWRMLGAAPPDGGAPDRQQGHVPPRPLGRREGGHHVVPGKAPGQVQRNRLARPAGTTVGRGADLSMKSLLFQV